MVASEMSDSVPLRGGPHHFCQKIPLRGFVQHRLRQKLLQPGALLLERSQAPGLRYVKATELGLPLVEVAELMPCFLQTSAVAKPASCSFRIPMICSSVKRLRFILSVLDQVGLYFRLEEISRGRSVT